VTQLPSTTTRAQPALVWAALVTVYLLWGSTYFGIRIAVETMPPFLMAGSRFLIAGLILFLARLPYALKTRSMPSAAHWGAATVIGAALLLGGNGAVAWAEQTVPSGVTALLVAMVPLWMALMDRVVYGKRLSALKLAGLIIGFGGIAVLVAGPFGENVPLPGAAALAIGSISWAAGSLYSRNATLPKDSLLTTGMEMLCGGACLCAAGLAVGEGAHVQLGSISQPSWIAFAYLVVFGGIVGFGAYLWVIREAPTSLVSTYAYVNPIVAVLLGSTFLHEPLTPRIVVAGAIVLASVALIVAATNRSATPLAERRA
jgi:drug/metabolite transporter (DMT)-like permease